MDLLGNFMQRHVLCTDMFIVLGNGRTREKQLGVCSSRPSLGIDPWRIDPYCNVGPVFQRNIQHVSLPLQRNLTPTRHVF